MNKSISNEIQNNLNHLEYSIIDVRQNITILIQNIDIRQSFEMSIYFYNLFWFMYEITLFVHTTKKNWKSKIIDKCTCSVRLLKLRTELETIHNSFRDKSIFEYLIGLGRKITFDFMLRPLAVCVLYSGSERAKNYTIPALEVLYGIYSIIE